MRILFFVTEDWYFCSHRLALAIAARGIGHEVIVVTRVRDHGEVIRQSGLRLIPFNCQRGSVNPLVELLTVIRLVRVYRSVHPDLVHHVAMKPVLYGSLAAFVCRIPNVVNAIAGLGWLFSSDTARARILKRIIRPVLGCLVRRGTVIVQNADDGEVVRGLGVNNVRTVRGSGVDTDQFSSGSEPNGTPVVMLVARLLREKGIEEFANAGRLLKSRGVQARLVLVGVPDPDNRSSVPIEILEHWVSKDWLEWWGRHEDMPAVLAQAHIACLPSYYGEGVPKSLIEAAACGLPIVTTDMPGCREIVRHGQNGLLVPARDSHALTDALETLIVDPQRRRSMGRCGRTMVMNEFAQEHVIAATLRIYSEFDDPSSRLARSDMPRL